MCVYIYIYIVIHVAPQGRERGAMGSKNPPAY